MSLFTSKDGRSSPEKQKRGKGVREGERVLRDWFTLRGLPILKFVGQAGRLRTEARLLCYSLKAGFLLLQEILGFALKPFS